MGNVLELWKTTPPPPPQKHELREVGVRALCRRLELPEGVLYTRADKTTVIIQFQVTKREVVPVRVGDKGMEVGRLVRTGGSNFTVARQHENEDPVEVTL